MACPVCNQSAGESVSYGQSGIERRCGACNSRTDLHASAPVPLPVAGLDALPEPVRRPAMPTPSPDMFSADVLMANIDARLAFLDTKIAEGERAKQEAARLRNIRAAAALQDEVSAAFRVPVGVS